MNFSRSEHFAKLVRRQGPALVLFARQWCEQAEDVVQEALLQLVQQEPPPENEVAWLYRVVRNRAMNASRANVRRAKHERSAADERLAWFEYDATSVMDEEILSSALQSLPTELRETIVARLWGDLSFAEVGELTDTSASTAYRRYCEGIQRLRERMHATTNASKVRHHA